MSRTPTGRLLGTSTGSDLVLTRTFRAPATDVWASLTEPDRTARWFGPWQGDAAPGRTIKVQLVFEDQAPWMDLRIHACEPPWRLAVTATDESGAWRVELLLSETDGVTDLRLVHHLDPDTEAQIGEVGPGWEYYLDMLLAARDGTPRPEFGDYYPAMKAYFDGLLHQS